MRRSSFRSKVEMGVKEKEERGKKKRKQEEEYGDYGKWKESGIMGSFVAV